MTATALFVPLEAYSRRPSGLIAKALGALPNSSFSAGFVEIVSTTFLASLSITEIVSLLALATRT